MRVRCPQIRGVVRMGRYVPGQIYDVPEDEAHHLIDAKGFDPIDPPATAMYAPPSAAAIDDDADNSVMED